MSYQIRLAQSLVDTPIPNDSLTNVADHVLTYEAVGAEYVY